MADGADVFAPLPDAPAASAGAGSRKSAPPPPAILPAPLPLPGVIRHRDHGTASHVWRYLAADGALLYAVARFDTAPGAKEVIPYVCTATRWRPGAPPAPRPLYGLDRLAARPGAPVVLVEGEKAADAAAALFPDHAAMTWQGGGNAVHLADWSALAGRDVTVWPDADAAGAEAAAAVVKSLRAKGAARVRVVALPDGLPNAWDVADPLPPGMGPDGLRDLLATAREAGVEDGEEHDGADADGTTWPSSFVMRDDGLFFLPQPKRNPQTGEEEAGTPMRLSSPFRVLGEARDAAGHGRALYLRWNDTDGREQRFALPRRMLHGDHGALAGELEERGLRCRTGQTYRAKLADALAGVRTPHRIASADRTGWHGAEGRFAYVTADGTAYGDGGERVILAGAGQGAAARVARSGTLRGWQDGVAAAAVGNHRLALFLAAAFAPPLLEIVGVEGGGVHLLGGSSTGKSTCLEAAASAWGSPRMGQQVRTWRATANALEAAAVECSDALLALDEIGLCDGRDVAAALYMLTGGAGRGRADRTGALRASRTWRTLFLSTGELSPADKIAEAGQRSRAGQDVRCVSIPADAGAGRGVWQVLHGHPSGEALSNAVKAAALDHHGHAARAFVEALTRMRAERPADLLGELRESVTAFGRGKHVPADADGQVRRVAQRFGLIAAAGDLAADLGILSWPEGEAERAAVACFTAWLTARGGHGAAEDREALTAVRAFIGAHGSGRFSTLLLATEQGSDMEEDSTRPVVNRAGWRRRTAAGWEYLILPEVWRGEVCRGLDHQHVARELDGAGLLQRGEGKNLAARVTIPGEGRPRLFIVLPGLLAGGDA